MSNRLFIGGMSWDTSVDGLREAFKECGEILDAVVITDRDTGRSRGFGFITFANKEDANQAITKMDGVVLDGRALVVNEARERQDRGGGDRRHSDGGRSGGGYRRY
jgi:cold-inducible RNA-binding protein